MRWVLAAHAVTALLYVLAAALNRPDTRLLTGYWYNDSHRLAAMPPVTAVPLAVAGVLLVAAKVRIRHSAAVLVAVLVVVTGGLHLADREARVTFAYPRDERHQLVTDEMRAFYDRVAASVPEDGHVIGNPFDGSVMLWALAGREVLFPHFLAAHSPGQAYLGRHLRHAASDPGVCRELARHAVTHVLIGKDEAGTAQGRYGGIHGVTTAEGFELVARAGAARLYRITACDRHP